MEQWVNGGSSNQSQADQAADVWTSQAGLTTPTGTLPMLNHTKCVRASLQGGGQRPTAFKQLAHKKRIGHKNVGMM